MSSIKRTAASWATKAKSSPAGPALGQGEAPQADTPAPAERKKPGPVPGKVARKQYGIKASDKEIGRLNDLEGAVRAIDGIEGKVDRSSALVAAGVAVEQLLRSEATSAALRAEMAALLASWHRHEEKPDY